MKYEVFDIDRPALFPLLRASIKALAKKRHTLARIILPYNIIDRYPILWRQATDISPFKNAGSGKIRVAVHIRRGELLVAFSDRMLPNQYYLSVMDLIKEALEKNNLDYEFEIYTEVPKKAFKVKEISDYSLAEVKELAPEQCGLSDFDAVEGLKWFINEDPIDDLERMATADIFVMSHSSFSMLAAVLNPRGIVIYHPFWHAQMPEWITADNSGNFDKKLFLRRLRSMEDMSKDDCISG